MTRKGKNSTLLRIFNLSNVFGNCESLDRRICGDLSRRTKVFRVSRWIGWLVPDSWSGGKNSSILLKKSAMDDYLFQFFCSVPTSMQHMNQDCLLALKSANHDCYSTTCSFICTDSSIIDGCINYIVFTNICTQKHIRNKYGQYLDMLWSLACSCEQLKLICGTCLIYSGRRSHLTRACSHMSTPLLL